MINAINNAGLGLTATFSTAAQSGAAVGGTETGIQISGGIISVGVDPNTASTGGTLNPSEITSGDLALGQVISVNSGSTNVATFTTTSSNDTLDQIARRSTPAPAIPEVRQLPAWLRPLSFITARARRPVCS